MQWLKFWLWDNFILENSPNHKTLILSLPSCFGTLCTSLLFFYQSDAAKNNIRVSKYFCRPQNLGRSTLVQIFLFIQKLSIINYLTFDEISSVVFRRFFYQEVFSRFFGVSKYCCWPQNLCCSTLVLMFIFIQKLSKTLLWLLTSFYKI